MNKVTPKILPGFMELLPEDQILFNQMYDTIRSVYERFGYLPLDTPVIEYSEVLLAKAGGETEKQIYRFNKGDADISLRFDLTVPLARYVSGHFPDLVFPFKRYQMSKVYRGERPQKGRFREFYQCDIDVIGNEELSILYDAEIPAVIYSLFKELQIGKFTIRINNRKVLNGFFESLGLLEQVADILRVIDKIDKIGKEAVEECLLDLNIDKDKVQKIMRFISIDGTPEQVLSSLNELDGTPLYQEGLSELKQVTENVRAFGIEEGYFKIDLTIARGLDYYTGTVYETILDEHPSLGSICSGGRYDNLTEYYTDKVLPGVGISIGLTRLFSKLKELGITESKKKSLVKVLTIPFSMENQKYALEVTSALRKSMIPADTYLLDKGFKQKLKYANRLGIPYIAIIGEEEEKEKIVSLKNMETGEQEKVTIETLIEKMR